MAQRFSAEIWADWAQTRIFDFLADFRNLPQWHPTVEEAELLTMDPYVRNARHLVRGRIAGRRIEAEIVTTELERPRLLVATAANAAAQTTDRFDLSPAEGGKVSLTYRTELQLNAPLRVIGPLMVPALTSAWGAAAAALERIMNDAPDLD